jgi:hypothetical protein
VHVVNPGDRPTTGLNEMHLLCSAIAFHTLCLPLGHLLSESASISHGKWAYLKQNWS